MFWRNSVSKTFMACLYYIAENIEKYEWKKISSPNWGYIW
jgi:hypothetical protein